MIKRELIERAIESAKARIYRLAENEKYGVGEVHQKKIDNQKEVMEVTVLALKKQMPMKPMIKYLGDDVEVECPCCTHCVIFMDSKKGNNYCQNCGQRLDWGEEHE